MTIYDQFNAVEKAIENLLPAMRRVRYPSIPSSMICKAREQVHQARQEVIRQEGKR